MDNSSIIKYLFVRVFAFASVVGENSNNGGRTWNTNNGTNIGLGRNLSTNGGLKTFNDNILDFERIE
jgi:hypothetical protein